MCIQICTWQQWMENFEINKQILNTYCMPGTGAATMKIKVDRAPALKVILFIGGTGRGSSLRECSTLITVVLNISVQGNGTITNIY